ncbi:MAG: protoheme IX farnesyltransferase [Alphaproteobacteria bacterium]|nr:protoheme IX farnesyltransferase [Alphaproteobacteria bacterium]
MSDILSIGHAPALTGGSTVSDFAALLKPRVMSLVVFTGLVGFLVAPGVAHPILALAAVLCIAIGSGAAGAINMWYERDVDALMFRTRGRPLPSGRVRPDEALSFGVILAVGSVVLMLLVANWAAALLLAAAICFYVFIYTIWLKCRTPQNIVIGGAAGAFPPVIGWVAAGGGFDPLPLVMFLIIFAWTPPHFWALALNASEDYARAGIPMLPVVAGPQRTRREIMVYSLILAPLAVSPWLLGSAGALYGVMAAGLSAVFVIGAVGVLRAGSDPRPAKLLFGYSIAYLFLIFALLLIDARPGVSV